MLGVQVELGVEGLGGLVRALGQHRARSGGTARGTAGAPAATVRSPRPSACAVVTGTSSIRGAPAVLGSTRALRSASA